MRSMGNEIDDGDQIFHYEVNQDDVRLGSRLRSGQVLGLGLSLVIAVGMVGMGLGLGCDFNPNLKP